MEIKLSNNLAASGKKFERSSSKWYFSSQKRKLWPFFPWWFFNDFFGSPKNQVLNIIYLFILVIIFVSGMIQSIHFQFNSKINRSQRPFFSSETSQNPVSGILLVFEKLLFYFSSFYRFFFFKFFICSGSVWPCFIVEQMSIFGGVRLWLWCATRKDFFFALMSLLLLHKTKTF